MATYTVTDLTTDASHGLRGVLGYWDDSASERVAGSAVAGDRVILSMTGTQDLGSDDNIIYPAVGVSIVGPGMHNLTIVGRFFAMGAGGTWPVLHMRDVTWAPTGLASVSSLGLAGGGSVCGVRNASIVFERVRFIDTSPIAASGNNLFTVDCRNAPSCVVVTRNCVWDGSNADCFSTRGEDGGDPHTHIALHDTGRNSGAADTDQPLTSHNGWRMYCWGGSFSRSTTGTGGTAISAVSPIDSYVANVITLGGIRLQTIVTSIVDAAGGTAFQGTTKLAKWVHFKNSGERIFSNIFEGGVVEDCAMTAFHPERAAVISSGVSTEARFTRVVVDGWRGFDMRGSTGTVTIEDCILNTSSLSALSDASSGPVITSGNLVTSASLFVAFDGPGDVIGAIDPSVVAAKVAEIESMFGTTLEPNADALVADVLAGNGDRIVNAADAPAIAAMYQAASPSDVRSGVTNLGDTGTLTLPAESDVDYGVQYGADGTEFTGEAALSAAAVRDAILNRVLAGNHDEEGTTGKVLQDAAAQAAAAAERKVVILRQQ